MSIDNYLREIEQKIQDEQELDYFLTHQVRYRFILEKVLTISKSKKLKILDIGCYPYHVGKVLEIQGHEVWGISSEHEPVKQKNVKVVNIETKKFPFKNKFFDLILCNEVIEHLPQSPVPFFKESLRVSKKGGHLMITTPNIARSINRLKLLFGRTIMYPTDVYFEDNGKGNNLYHRHNKEWTLNELKTIAEKTGWDVEQEEYFISYTPSRKRLDPDPLPLKAVKYVNYGIMKLLPSWKDTLYVLGRKK